MTKKRRQYSDDFRANCVLMLEAAGYPDKEGSLTAVANKVGVAPRTISRWFNKENNPPPDEIVRLKKGELVEKLDTAIHLMLDSITGDMERIDDASLRDVTMSLAISIDKLQLLSNKPTAIVKLEQLIRDGKITPEQVKERYPAVAEQLARELFANVER